MRNTDVTGSLFLVITHIYITVKEETVMHTKTNTHTNIQKTKTKHNRKYEKKTMTSTMSNCSVPNCPAED